MGRRNEHSRAEIKKMAVEAGRKILKEEGFSGLSARKIARTIGYTVGTLYNVFDNYMDMIFHINAQTLDELTEKLENCVKTGTTGTQAIKNLGITYQEYALDNNNLWSALFEYPRPDGDMPEWYAEKVNTLFSLPVKYLTPMCNGDIELAREHTSILWAGVHGICALGSTQRLCCGDDDPLDSKVVTMIENYLRGLTTDI